MRAPLIVHLWLLLVACQRPADAAPSAPSAKRVRAATVAGQFYPGNPKELEAAVRKLFAAAPKVAAAPVKVILTPHAGYEFSGAVAAASFRQLSPGFERAVIVAGNHTSGLDYRGAAVDRATHYAVPGLEVEVAPAAAKLLSRPGFVEAPEAHTKHIIEVELPFLREANQGKPFQIVPLVVGWLEREEAARLASELARLDDGRTVFVFSVDLSHFHPYDTAVGLDRPCLSALARADAEAVQGCDTDATQVLLAMTELGARLALTPRLVSYANSGDVSGDRSRVVGYGSLVFEDRFELFPEEAQALTALARRSIEARVREGREPEVPKALAARFPRLFAERGAFVTLREAGALRGCIGTLEAHQPLAVDVAQNAVNAAIHDSRFSAVRPEELDKIALSVSVLDKPRPLAPMVPEVLLSKLGETKPGLILEFERRRSTFLPEVWEEVPQPADFLAHLCRKQGSPSDCWRSAGARFLSYGSQHLSESSR
jgi:AmmeMemoRadiSam system protein B/AmmeMemoRadiSam system protein A